MQTLDLHTTDHRAVKVSRNRKGICIQVELEPQAQRLTGDRYCLVDLTSATASQLREALQATS